MSIMSVMSHDAMNVDRNKPQQVAHESMLEFERIMKKASHGYCHSCREVSLNIAVDSSSLCKNCRKTDAINYVKEHLQPVWVDRMGNTIFTRPDVITNLRLAEIMLIQQASPYVPVQYINFGTFGLKGHVCMFPQDINEIVQVLPRLPSQVKMLRMVHTYQDSVGGTHNKIFTVRRQAVLDALRWLKQHNLLYRSIRICEENLQWMGDKDEADFPAVIVQDASSVDNSDKRSKVSHSTANCTIFQLSLILIHVYYRRTTTWGQLLLNALTPDLHKARRTCLPSLRSVKLTYHLLARQIRRSRRHCRTRAIELTPPRAHSSGRLSAKLP